MRSYDRMVSDFRALLQSRVSPQALRLFFCGAAILFWELVLIRWMGACVRIVAYFSNFILLSAFLGLGAGALLASRPWRLEKWLLPTLTGCLILGPILAPVGHFNPESSQYIWLGGTLGVPEFSIPGFHWLPQNLMVPYWVLLTLVFVANGFVFVILGQMVGILFGALPPLRAYSIEIGGSVLGILLFGGVSFWLGSPMWWFGLGFVLLLPVLKPGWKRSLLTGACLLITLLVCGPYIQAFYWSPYYKISVNEVLKLYDPVRKGLIDFPYPGNFRLAVNNDYHQLILNLAPRTDDHPFLKSWREKYDLPYQDMGRLPPGPILVVGAGTGNDVSAALRNTDRPVDAVEIDPRILMLGRTLHPEQPYSNPRVRWKRTMVAKRLFWPGNQNLK